MVTLNAVDRIDVLVLVDNVTDSLSTTPPNAMYKASGPPCSVRA
jgi:hypothetical protein